MRFKAGLAVAAAGALLLAGCSGTPAPEGDATGGDDPADVGTLVVGIEAPWDLAYVPTSLAVAKMQEEGYDVEFVQFEDPDAMTSALDNGDIHVAAGSASQVLAAADAGLETQWVLGLTNPSFVLVAQAGLEQCSDLDGRRVGVQGQTDLILAMTKNFISETCDGTEPEYVELPGSENRMNALLADQIDASGIHLLRQRQLDQEYPGDFTTIDGFAAPEDVISGVFFALTSWLEENEDIMAAFANAYDETIQEIADDPQIAVDEAQRLITDVDPDLLAEVTEIWATSNYWPGIEGTSEEVFEATYEFYDGITPFESELTYDQVVWNAGY